MALGVLGWPYGVIWGIMKTLKRHLILVRFEHLEVLGGALEFFGMPYGVFGDPCS